MLFLCALVGFPFLCALCAKIFGASPLWLAGLAAPAPKVFATRAKCFGSFFQK
jgi:hypothetical protein